MHSDGFACDWMLAPHVDDLALRPTLGCSLAAIWEEGPDLHGALRDACPDRVREPPVTEQMRALSANRLRRVLHGIRKLEKREAEGGSLDPQQRRKVARRPDMELCLATRRPRHVRRAP